MYLIRLDDASDCMDVDKWQRIENLLDQYGVRPLVGVIPENHDSTLTDRYEPDREFWNKVKKWEKKGWEIALHGWHHVYVNGNGGLNPVNRRSEFAGVGLDRQQYMIRDAVGILKKHDISPKVFFAPSHTYDENTLQALRLESDIRIISDTVASDVYYDNGFYFVPVQSGRPRKLPLNLVTICLHPNVMDESSFKELEGFLHTHRIAIVAFGDLRLRKRKLSPLDRLLRSSYFMIKRLKSI